VRATLGRPFGGYNRAFVDAEPPFTGAAFEFAVRMMESVSRRTAGAGLWERPALVSTSSTPSRLLSLLGLTHCVSWVRRLHNLGGPNGTNGGRHR